MADAVRDRNDRIAERDSWTTVHELLAQIVEWLSLIRVEALVVGGAKSHQLPKVHRVPRPYDKPEVPMTPREFAMLTAA